MHAVVVQVKLVDPEGAREALTSQVVPQVSRAPGFKAAYWTWDEGRTNGLSMAIFDSADNARQAAERVRGMVPEAVSLETVDVREVVASA